MKYKHKWQFTGYLSTIIGRGCFGEDIIPKTHAEFICQCGTIKKQKLKPKGDDKNGRKTKLERNNSLQ